MLAYKIFVLLLMLKHSLENTLEPIKETNLTLSRKLDKSIGSVLHESGREVDEIYEKSLFDISKSYFKVGERKIAKLFNYNADLINYVEKHSYLEVLWCFKLTKDITLKQTFERIKSMEPKNQFTIFSATGSKPWPSGKNEPRHSVCDTISKQPITSGLYENFLVPARAKALGIKQTEFTKVKNFFDIEQYATRLEFAQALHIDIVIKRIQPKISDTIVDKLNTITLNSIKKRSTKVKNVLLNQPVITMLANAYNISKNALSITLKFYTKRPKVISLLDEASFKSVTHLIKNPRPENTSFGEIYEHLELALVDFKKTLNTPIIIELDRNHVLSNIINKTLINAFITIVKEPSDVITSFYELSPEQKKFLTFTRVSKLHMLISQSSLRLQHLSIHYFMDLLLRQTKENLMQGKFVHKNGDINTAYLESIKSIMRRITLGDFLRIYHKAWTKPQLMRKTLLKLAVHQGLTGNEFLQVYGLEKQNISKITLFTNYTLDMLERKKKHLYYYTFEELGEFVKKEIRKISEPEDEDALTGLKDVHSAGKISKKEKYPEKANTKKDEIERPKNERNANAVEQRTQGPRPLYVIAPTLFCVFSTIAALIGWIYYERRKAWRSAW